MEQIALFFDREIGFPLTVSAARRGEIIRGGKITVVSCRAQGGAEVLRDWPWSLDDAHRQAIGLDPCVFITAGRWVCLGLLPDIGALYNAHAPTMC